MSIEVLRKRERKVEIEHQLCFDEIGELGCGFVFKCDINGNVDVDTLSPDALANYVFCLKNPEKYRKHISRQCWRYTEPAIGLCSCGEHVTMRDEFRGAFMCPNCGQWYNLWGEELESPYEWDDPLGEDF